MNFFAHQEQARRQTRRLLWLFALAVAVIVAATDFVLLALPALDYWGHGNGGIGWASVFVMSAFVVLVIGLGSLYRTASLRGGGGVVARELGAVPVASDTSNFAYRRLRNVIEELAIAAGVPVPEIYVLEEEAGINAFASGYAPTDAAVTVTRGALDKLTREELQGVIGHEFSHILNGDMRLNIRLIGIVFGILLIATAGRKVIEMYRVRNRGRSDFFGLALLGIGYIGVVFVRVIKASVSRQREFLADASAVQFTRQTEGIAGALKKIGGLAEGSRLASSDKEEVAHMLFGDGVGYSALFATHPPLGARILRLDPGFRIEEFKAIAAAWSQPERVADGESNRSDISISGFAPAVGAATMRSAPASVLPAADAAMRLSPQAVVHQVGNPGTDDQAGARHIRTTMPARLREAAWQPEQAMLLIFALLLNDEPDTRARQLDLLRTNFDAGSCAVVDRLGVDAANLHPMQRLPLAALAFPTLRRRPRAQLATFMVTLQQLIDADGEVTLDEYCLARLIRMQVMDSLNPATRQAFGRTKLPDVAIELGDVLAIVAQYGHDDTTSAQRAYMLGLQEALPDLLARYAPPDDWAAALDRALPKLDLLLPAGKELVVRALTRAISANGIVSVAEAELLRTICAALHCPLPPLLQTAA